MSNVLKNAAEEIWGLFVDDPIFAASLIVWVVAIKLTLSMIPHAAAGPVLFAGLVVLLVGLTYRQAAGIRRK